MKKNNDKEIVEVQLKRKVRSHIDIRNRCHLGLPVVTFVPPNLNDGTPFPTTYWLTCPLLVQRVSSLEASSMVKVFDEIIQKKGSFSVERSTADGTNKVRQQAGSNRSLE